MGMHGRAEKKAALYALGKTCGLCGLHVPYKKATLDHILPRSLGGSNQISNLQLAHGGCNNKKGANDGPGRFFAKRFRRRTIGKIKELRSSILDGAMAREVVGPSGYKGDLK